MLHAQNLFHTGSYSTHHIRQKWWGPRRLYVGAARCSGCSCAVWIEWETESTNLRGYSFPVISIMNGDFLNKLWLMSVYHSDTFTNLPLSVLKHSKRRATSRRIQKQQCSLSFLPFQQEKPIWTHEGHSRPFASCLRADESLFRSVFLSCCLWTDRQIYPLLLTVVFFSFFQGGWPKQLALVHCRSVYDEITTLSVSLSVAVSPGPTETVVEQECQLHVQCHIQSPPTLMPHEREWL